MLHTISSFGISDFASIDQHFNGIKDHGLFALGVLCSNTEIIFLLFKYFYF